MHRSSTTLYLVSLLTLGIATSFAATSPTAATTAREGLANARIHASVAVKVDSIEGVHLHLHHVINCLEGPHGKLYSAKAEALSAYHCDGLKTGAVDDPAAGARVHQLATQAVREAAAGVHAANFEAAHRDATEVVKSLDSAEAAWPHKS